MRAHDLRGRVFYWLTAEKRAPDKNGETQWVCVCVCGKKHNVATQNLLNGTTKSCGCYRKSKRTTHGASGTKTYNIWKAMRKRCANPNDPAYARYGGRGISVCKRWQSYVLFLQDMGACPKGCSLERRDNNKGYRPSNCYWSTRLEQNANTARNRNLLFDGETLHVAEWARRIGISSRALTMRLNLGWTTEDALLTPLYGKRKK
jgi:hypothetical protein